MSRFDRYMLSQLMTLFGFFSLVLVAVYWVNRAVLLFNHLVGDGQSVQLFLEFTALSLPNVIRIMLPVSAFAASVYVTNRLSTESELVVMQAVGFSAFRLARPVLIFGIIVAVLVSLLGHVLVPASRTALAQRTVELSQNITAKFLSEGKFLHPAPGLTLFISRINQQGEMHDIYLSDARSARSRTTYSARRALLVQSESGPKLVMFDGMAQTLDLSNDHLAVTRFQESTYDLASLIAPAGIRKRDVDELSTPVLLRADPADIAQTDDDKAQFLYTAHRRFADALNAIVTALIGFAALLQGRFSRFGNWRKILMGVFLLIVMQILIDWSAGVAVRNAHLWPVTYLPALIGGLASVFLLWRAQQPARRPILRARLSS
ncbi:LPS export ABC transporter permease LptF [Thioclava sp. BHET1]|nr:LPS export ABC transporter permease LptF [Thioclava sp. BHET1]